jgi:hypothetical protein
MPGFRLVAAELTSLSEPESEAAVGLEPPGRGGKRWFFAAWFSK